MTLPVSGPISLSQVNVELGLSATAPISMNDAAVRTLFGVGGSGTAISMSQGYGKSNQFAFTISSNQTNANLRTLAVNAGWNQSTKVVATISGGVYISSNSTGTPALTVNGSFPGGVELINNGFIIGMGGNGGRGADNYYGNTSATAGSSGGLALSVSSAISINNGSGTIGGGGGGGGGGASYLGGGGDYPPSGSGGGGGGGRSSAAANSSGGSRGTTAFNSSSPPADGSAGTVSSAGGGGQGGNHGSGSTRGGTGGTGGGWGSAGAGGGNSINIGNYRSPGGGGSAGGAVSGNGNITWLATGTRLGGIS